MRTKLSRRNFLGMAAAATAGGLMAACQPAAPQAVDSGAQDADKAVPAAADPVTLNVWGWTDLVWTETFDNSPNKILI
jgi:hypothetical protein